MSGSALGADLKTLLYFLYWGKARPSLAGPQLHLLAYHSLDVAAVGVSYLRSHPALLAWLSRKLGGARKDAVCSWIGFWLALHDLGKFSLSFQGQREDLIERLRGELPGSLGLGGARHDSLGAAGWRRYVLQAALAQNWFGEDPDVQDGIDSWVRAVTGHHGQPPTFAVSHLERHFPARDGEAALGFASVAREMFLQPGIAAGVIGDDMEKFANVSEELSWWIAGLAVLADWIGSNADIFRYHDEPTLSLPEYWAHALQRAESALLQSGVLPVKRQAARSFNELFPRIVRPSPLQAWASKVAVSDGPQFFLLEDVTGAGKTEAAVTLAHRLMASDAAEGFFIGLPTMATANAMYERVANVYALLFGGVASLALAHGRKSLVESFAASVVLPGSDEQDAQQGDDESATRRCLRWLADHNKRALLAPAGVGTIDQALLAALQSRHQSLRLLGLMRKVLVVDEVHACDAYMQRTLEALLEFHAHAGGCVILLSATLPSRMKVKLLAAFARGCGRKTPALAQQAYPLVTVWSPELQAATETSIATRPEVSRKVSVRYEADVVVVIDAIVAVIKAGGCVAWIRNTVGDALRARDELAQWVPEDRITLFHARFALGDRLDIEERVLEAFGPESTPEQRSGRLLISTQVAEQSLDIDVDLLVSDLAPIDRLIQRAGRLRRHVRNAEGRRLLAPQAVDGRGEPVMWVFGPAWNDAPAADWVRSALPGSAVVYPHHGELWRTARALQAGYFCMPDDARALIEAVFAEDEDLPEGLRNNAGNAEGRAMGDRSEAMRNTAKLASGYARLGLEWSADTVAPSRLGEETIDVVLCRWEGDRLLPWRHDKPFPHAWAYSSVRVAKRLITEAVEPEAATRRIALEEARTQVPGGGKWMVLLPLEVTGSVGRGMAQFESKPPESGVHTWQYDNDRGLRRA